MPIGKLCAQAGHGYVNAFQIAQQRNTQLITEYQKNGLGTKVCLVSKGLDDLLMAHDLAIGLDIPCSLIEDSGHVLLPHFTGQPIVTALGIGPCTREQVYSITKRFKLL